MDAAHWGLEGPWVRRVKDSLQAGILDGSLADVDAVLAWLVHIAADVRYPDWVLDGVDVGASPVFTYDFDRRLSRRKLDALERVTFDARVFVRG